MGTKGQVLGKISYSIDEKEISNVNIIAKEDVKKLGLINMSSRVVESWFKLLR